MALARVTTWNPGDTLTAAALNGEFNNILNNPISLISPSTGAINFQTSVAHTNLTPSAITASSGVSGNALITSTGGTTLWGATPARSSVRGLLGTVTSSQTVTLQADQYVLQTTATLPSFFTLASTASFTVNVGTSGPAANGRDVGPVFSSTFVHVYAITTGFNSTTPAGIASTTPPPAGPVLPTSYNAFTYLGTYQYSSASTTFTAAQRPRGNRVYYEGLQAALTNGASTVEAAVNVAGFVPLIALDYSLRAVWAAGASGGTLTIRVISGTDYQLFYSPVVSQTFSGWSVLPNVSQQFFYVFTATGDAFTANIGDYKVPNGGE